MFFTGATLCSECLVVDSECPHGVSPSVYAHRSRVGANWCHGALLDLRITVIHMSRLGEDMGSIAISHRPPTQLLFKQAKSGRVPRCLLAFTRRYSSLSGIDRAEAGDRRRFAIPRDYLLLGTSGWATSPRAGKLSEIARDCRP